MNTNLRPWVVGILIGTASEVVAAALLLNYLPIIIANVVMLPVILAGDATAALIASSSRKGSMLACMATGVLYAALINAINYTRGVGIYSSLHTASFLLVGIAYQVIALEIVAAVMGLITYRLFIKKTTADEKVVSRRKTLHNMRLLGSVLIGGFTIAVLVVGTPGPSVLLGVFVGGAAAALIASGSKRASIAVGAVATLVSLIAVYPDKADAVSGIRTGSLLVAWAANTGVFGSAYAAQIFLAMLYLLLGGLGGLTYYYLRLHATGHKMFLRNMRATMGILIGAVLAAVLAIGFPGIMIFVWLPIGGMAAALIASGSRKFSFAVGVAAVLISFIFGTAPGLSSKSSASSATLPNSETAFGAVTYALSGFVYTIHAIVMAIYLLLGGIGGIAGYYTKKPLTHAGIC
jgi:hypothetical protein